MPGRPEKYKSTYGKDESPFGRDALGRGDLRSGEAGENSSGLKNNFRGGSAIALEGTMAQYLKNKSALDSLLSKTKGRKTNLFESKTLDEENIMQDPNPPVPPSPNGVDAKSTKNTLDESNIL
jgi:hypothetical protein